jgi:hypothetical protein
VVRNRVLFCAAIAGLAVSLAGCQPVGYGYVAPVYAHGYYGGYAVPLYGGDYYGGYVGPVYADGYYGGYVAPVYTDSYYGGYGWRHGYYGGAYHHSVYYRGHGVAYHGRYWRR